MSGGAEVTGAGGREAVLCATSGSGRRTGADGTDEIGG